MVAVPDRILSNWREWYGSRARSIAGEVAARAAAAIEAWGLRDASTIDSGEVALVLECRRGADPVICKLNPPDPALGDEAAGLASWSGLCPELLGTRDEGRTMLMQRLDPGTPLAGNAGSVDGELSVIGALAGRLHRAPAPAVARLAGSELAAEWSGALAPAEREELADLLEGGEREEVVIHTDLHANNVLRHGGDWKLIDPKPFRARPEAEIWALVDATGLPEPGAGKELRRRLLLYCEAAALDPAAALRWTRVRARAEANLALPGSEWRRELDLVADALDA